MPGPHAKWVTVKVTAVLALPCPSGIAVKVTGLPALPRYLFVFILAVKVSGRAAPCRKSLSTVKVTVAPALPGCAVPCRNIV